MTQFSGFQRQSERRGQRSGLTLWLLTTRLGFRSSKFGCELRSRRAVACALARAGPVLAHEPIQQSDSSKLVTSEAEAGHQVPKAVALKLAALVTLQRCAALPQAFLASAHPVFLRRWQSCDDCRGRRELHRLVLDNGWNHKNIRKSPKSLHSTSLLQASDYPPATHFPRAEGSRRVQSLVSSRHLPGLKANHGMFRT